MSTPTKANAEGYIQLNSHPVEDKVRDSGRHLIRRIL